MSTRGDKSVQASSAAGTGGEAALDAGRERRIRRSAILQEARELRRLRRDLEDRLELLQTDAEKQEADARAVREAVQRLRNLLSEAPDVPDDLQDDAAALGPLRRSLERIRIEVVKVEQTRSGGPAGDAPIPDLASLSLRQLLRLGFGLTWPVAVALLAVGLAVCAVLYALFAA